MFIDSHSHIYADDFDIDTEVADCLSVGVDKIYMPNIDVDSIPKLKSVAEKYPEQCIPMMGLHPCYVKEDYESQLKIIEKELRDNNYAAVGEIGMDLYWDKTFVEEQKKAFAYQISLAKELGLCINVHARNANDECIEIVRAHQDGNLTGIFHCFSGSKDHAAQILDLNFYMGIGGVVTFKNAGLDKVVEDIPLERIVLETDAPYLAPTPYRGKTNSSKYIPLIGEKIAEIKKIIIEEVARITTENCNNLYK